MPASRRSGCDVEAGFTKAAERKESPGEPIDKNSPGGSTSIGTRRAAQNGLASIMGERFIGQAIKRMKLLNPFRNRSQLCLFGFDAVRSFPENNFVRIVLLAPGA